MTTISLTNYSTSTPVELAWERVVELRQHVAGRLTVIADDRPGLWRITAGQYVGTVVAAGLRILIRPSIAPSNLFHLLEVGGDALDVRPEAIDYERTGDLLPAFATFYARVVERALLRGVCRDYEQHQESLLALRGRVDVTAQMRRAGVMIPVDCRFDEYTADIALNRVLRAAADRLLRVPGVTISTKAALALIAARLDEAGPLRAGDLGDLLAFTRLNAHCESAYRLARMVLGESALVDRLGDAAAGTFLVNMPRVFEQFVLTRLQQYLPELAVLGQASHRLDPSRIKPTVRPDIEIRRGATPVFVADTKYKLTDDGLGRVADYYQLLAYAVRLNVPEALLIYCHDDGEAPATEVLVENSNKVLWARAISLSVPPSGVDAQLRELADWTRSTLDRRSAIWTAGPDAVLVATDPPSVEHAPGPTRPSLAGR